MVVVILPFRRDRGNPTSVAPPVPGSSPALDGRPGRGADAPAGTDDRAATDDAARPGPLDDEALSGADPGPYDLLMAATDEVTAARLAARDAAVADTRAALSSWLRRPSQLLPWVGLSAVVSAILLLGTYIVAITTPADPSGGALIAADPSARWVDFGFVLGRNFTVLLLHLLVCFATYLVRRSIPIQAGELSGVQGWVHRHAQRPALLVVIALTVFSIVQQALNLGHGLASVAAQGQYTEAGILVRLLPHAVPELVAVFLPLAAVVWLEAKDRNRDLLAAVAACTVVAVPVIVVSAWIEVAVASSFF
ncbi:unannotated protein [freshwater metagenome]|uniref:Unannotated protein n=1 Tax=freshwater metagenome TaxID=449393 RepID=A0A6J7FFZ7_9ZZZZ